MLTAVRCIFGRIVHLQTALRCQWDKCRKNNLLFVSPSIRRPTVYGRMIEIYLMTSLAPIPFATIANREAGHMGHNYFKSLFAVGFQGMLIMVCMAIYAVLVQGIATGGDLMGAIWTCVGYTVLLCFVLFKTGSLSKSIWGAH